MAGRVGDREVRVAAADHVSAALQDAVRHASERGETVSVIECDGEAVGVVSFADRIRPGAREAIARLRSIVASGR